MKKVNFIFIQPHFRKFDGHYFDYIYSLSQNLNQSTFDVSVYGARDALPEIQSQFSCFIPFFSAFAANSPLSSNSEKEPNTSLLAKYRSKSFKFLRKFRKISHTFLFKDITESFYFMWESIRFVRAIKKKFAKTECVFFVDTIQYFRILGYAFIYLMIKRGKVLQESHFFLFLRFSNHGDHRLGSMLSRWITKFAVRSLLRCCSTANVTLFTDSVLLKKEQEDLLKVPVQLLPIPAFRNNKHGSMSCFKQKNNLRKVITYWGGNNAVKGSEFVFRLLCSQKLSEANVEVHAQFDAQEIVMLKKQFAQNCSFLERNINNKYVNFLPKNIPSDQYDRIIERTDIMLLPYQGKHYAKCTSGIFTDCLANNKVPVASSGTWIAYELAQLNLNQLIFESGSYSSFEKKVLDVANDYHSFQKSVAQISDNWRKFHNPKSLADNIVKLVSFIP